MRRTLIGAAAAAGITTVAATGLAFAQERQDQQSPATQHRENGRPTQIEKRQRTTEPGAGQRERKTGKEAQEERTPPEKERGQVGAEAQGLPNAQQEKAQTGQPEHPRKREPEKAQMGQAAQPERAPTGQAVAPETRQGGQIESGQAPRIGQGQPSNETAARPRANAVATGKIQISSAAASQITDALMSTGRSQNISVAVNIGAPPPGNVDL
jgi:hypothetical protein